VSIILKDLFFFFFPFSLLFPAGRKGKPFFPAPELFRRLFRRIPGKTAAKVGKIPSPSKFFPTFFYPLSPDIILNTLFSGGKI
jgi:hypothetical protein